MSKNFDEFMAQMDKKDWSAIIDRLRATIADMDISDESSRTLTLAMLCIETSTLILREYHQWINNQQ